MDEAYPSHEERLKAVTDKLEAGVTEVFAGGRFADYLRTMSKFHQYSFGNILLIAIQFPGATQVAGFHDWKRKFERHVKKGEKGIQILAPCSFRGAVEQQKLDPVTRQPLVTTMCTTWHTVATRDTRLLRRQLDIVNALPKEYVFLNYLRCHDDIGWGLDYDTLKQWGISEVPHKKFLSDWFQGYAEGSVSRGELYNDDPSSGDARQCGTTASLCGIEKAGFEQDQTAMERAVRFDLTLHAMMFMQTGIPLLYSGDEIAQVNDYSYKDDPKKAEDSRYLHRGKMHWELAKHAEDLSTPEGRVFNGLNALGALRKTNPAFGTGADVWTLDAGDDGLLAVGRYFEGQKIIGIFNFTGTEKSVTLPWDKGQFTDLLTGEAYELQDLIVPAYGFYYMEQTQI